jgi:hypothetical protein
VIVMPAIGPSVVAARRVIEEQFLELVLADEELLRAEFDAIIAAAWSGPPPSRPPRRIAGKPASTGDRGPRIARTGRAGPGRQPLTVAARQRAPPTWQQKEPRGRKAGDRPLMIPRGGDRLVPPARSTPGV